MCRAEFQGKQALKLENQCERRVGEGEARKRWEGRRREKGERIEEVRERGGQCEREAVRWRSSR